MNVTGLTVHIGARVGAAAEPGQVLVSLTVHDLVAGSGLTFASRGEHDLKGIPGRWELYEVTHAGDQPEDLPLEESMQTSMVKMVLQTARTAPGFVRAAVRLGTPSNVDGPTQADPAHRGGGGAMRDPVRTV